ncbi:MAG: hypothetical protein IT392_13640, partial [Nitrospirae bacterium]|nr:hypothetical protein [Nitrospirota bacterium]
LGLKTVEDQAGVNDVSAKPASSLNFESMKKPLLIAGGAYLALKLLSSNLKYIALGGAAYLAFKKSQEKPVAVSGADYGRWGC